MIVNYFWKVRKLLINLRDIIYIKVYICIFLFVRGEFLWFIILLFNVCDVIVVCLLESLIFFIVKINLKFIIGGYRIWYKKNNFLFFIIWMVFKYKLFLNIIDVNFSGSMCFGKSNIIIYFFWKWRFLI